MLSKKDFNLRRTLCKLLLATLSLGGLPVQAQRTSQQSKTLQTKTAPPVASRSSRSPLVPEHLRVIQNQYPLPPVAFHPLPLTAIKPRGWLHRQLQIQAEGLTGHIDEFWKDLSAESAWLGGDGEDWERGPYYMDGLVPLAYLLDDPKLIAKANKWVNWTLEHQQPDGLIGPKKNPAWWSRMIMMKVLTQHYEATGDKRVIPVMHKYLLYHLKHAAERPLTDWAKYRWGDEVMSAVWLYNRTGDEKLLELARVMHSQGYDWRAQFENFKYTTKTNKQMLGLKPDMSNTTEESLQAHGVNNSMAMKAEAVWSQVSRDAGDRNSIYKMLDELDRYHLLPNGLHSGDEHYAGLNPSQGVETCTIVESVFSLKNLISVIGDAAFADRMEKIAFNALPGAFTGDMWAHQYDQQPNQISSDVRPRAWTTNGDESNVFGFEPYFGCCTANMHQGFPKFAASLWMATGDGEGLAAVAYAPSEVKTFVKGNVPISITEDTEYPFRPNITFTINPVQPVAFPLQLRIPAWADKANITINKVRQENVKPGTFHTITRTWKAGDKVELTLPLTTRTSKWLNDSIALERGAIIFSLKIGEDFSRLTSGMHKPAPPPAVDWKINPTTPWNYGLIVPASDAGLTKSIEVINKPIGDFPFTAAGAPVELKIKARRVPEWTIENNSAAAPPKSPVVSREPVETVTLIPYGAAKLRITAFPRIAQK